MCGISLILAKNNINIRELILLNEPIKHRGPDDEGYYVYDNVLNDFHIYGGNETPQNVFSSDINYTPSKLILNENIEIKLGFGHRRLSILDLSAAGHLPMSYLSQRYWITYNGEVYNFIEIRNELISLGYHFNTESDTEVILASYHQWGSACVERFIGMWAFAIFDSETNKIFICRDRFGIKPLYLYENQGNLYFASEIKQFLNLPNWISKLNVPRALDFLNYSLTDHTNETLFDGVRIFPAACYAEFEITNFNHELNYIQYYELCEDNFKGNLDEANLKFKEIFDQSINLHLRADVPVGTALSGGLDSTVIVGAVNRILHKLDKTDFQKTFSSCSIYDEFNEKKWVDIVKDEFSLNSFYCYPTIANLEDDLKKLIYSLDEPSQSMSAFLGNKVFELAKKENVKVLINGQGADEILGGYGQFINIKLLESLKGFKFRSFCNDIIQINKNRHIGIFNIFKGLFIHLIKFNRFKVGKFKFVNISDKIINSYTHPLNLKEDSIYSQKSLINYHLFQNALPRYLRWEDRNSMAHNIEARVPFLDHRLVDFSATLPVKFLERNGLSKNIIRTALSIYLPLKIKNRKDKKGFITPEEKWLKYENPMLFRDLLLKSVEYSNGFINKEIINYFDDVVDGREKFDYTYWRYIQFGFWMKRFKVKYEQ